MCRIETPIGTAGFGSGFRSAQLVRDVARPCCRELDEQADGYGGENKRGAASDPEPSVVLDSTRAARMGLILFAGLGPLTDGIRHAASVAADFPCTGSATNTYSSITHSFPWLSPSSCC